MNATPTQFITAFCIGLLLLFVLVRLFLTPIRLAIKLFLNSLAGGLLLLIINVAGSMAGINIGVNLVTSALTGTLGVPGIALLLFLQIILKA